MTQFVVEERLRGEAVGVELTTFSYGVGGSCDYGFEQFTRYLVHASRRPDGTWGVFLCGGTAPLERAATELTYIRDALAQPGEGTVSGNAFIDTDPGRGARHGHCRRILLRSSSKEWTARSDNEGHYQFQAVPAGEYTLALEVPSGYQPITSRRISVGKGACVRRLFFTMKL